MKKLAVLIFAVVMGISVYAPNAYALGECGLSCCIGGASTSGVTLASNLGLSLQYEYSDMGSIREGTRVIAPDTVINKKWVSGSSFSVPTKMTMQKLSLIAGYPATEILQFLSIVPYVKNDMDMRMKGKTGTLMKHTMDTVQGIGDITLLGLYTAYTDAPIRPEQRLTLGFGLKTPTGKNDVLSGSGYVHAMMQPGSGSWDPLFMVGYMRAFYPLVLQVNLFYHLTTRGDEGYEYGDQLSLDLISRYQVANYVNLGLDLNGINAGKDSDHDGKYSKPATSMVDNIENTGLTSAFLSPAVQIKIPNTGGSAEIKYQIPVYQNVNGYQQVIDSRILASITWNF